MNSSARTGPVLVFIVGIAALLYSLSTAFRSNELSTSVPQIETPPKAPAQPEPPAPQPARPSQLNTIFRPPVVRVPPEERVDPEAWAKEAKKDAEDYLGRHGIRLNLPEDLVYGVESDGPVDILVGSSDPESAEFYLFSIAGKYDSQRAKTYLREYFDDEPQLRFKGDGQSYQSRSGFRDMTLFKGVTTEGSQFQAYFFVNPKTNRSHILLLDSKNLDRNPAKVRSVVDSIKSAN